MTVLRELITILGFDVDETAAARAEKVFDGLKTGALAVVGAVVAVTVALDAMVRETVAAGDAAAKTGKRLGITAEEVQELAFAAERSGVPIAALNNGIRSLQRRAADASRGNKEFGQGFARLGVKVTDAHGKLKPTPQLLLDVATGFTKITNEGERTAIAMRVAGDGGAMLLPLFLEGAEGIDALRRRARVLGHVLDNETAVAAERLADNFTDIGLLFTGVSRRIGTRLLPLVEKLTNGLIDLFIANRELIDRGIDRLVAGVEDVIDFGDRLYKTIVRNKDLLLLMAAAITGTLLPALSVLLGGYALLIAKAAVAAVVMLGPWVLLIAFGVLLALIIDDIIKLLNDEESAIGNLYDAFQKEAQKPGAHWIVQTLAEIIGLTKRALEDTDDFFKIWMDQSIAGGGLLEGLLRTLEMAGEGVALLFKNMGTAVWNSLSMAGEGVALLFKNLLKEISRFSRESGNKLAEALGGKESFLGGLFFGGTGQISQEQMAALAAMTPGAAPAAPAFAGSTATTVQGGPISVNVQTGSGDPNAIADAVAAKVSAVVDDKNREALREVEGRVKR